ncbi:MAG: RAMP superfamily protein [Syntrophorhabdaceae bacterium PtaU1.Bin034]|jgi:CRISPR-associated protein Csm3|nr:MAG: RAMP superfamily protein [Syntrophorhabdaceae bacterium PtaU1.Bin034]
MKLTSIKKLEGTIALKSGLHIGAGDMDMHIGGTDSTVIKHPHTLEPYIPGSSLKGKVRSLLEMASGLVAAPGNNGGLVTVETWKKADNPEFKARAEAILKIFGSSGGEDTDITGFGPTRVSFSDCYLDKDWQAVAKTNRYAFTEVKSENKINRISGTADHPRFIERVPEGTRFGFLITFKVLQNGDERLFDEYLLKGLKMLELDAVGGSGSRGYGRIKFVDRFLLDGKDILPEFDAMDPFVDNDKP